MKHLKLYEELKKNPKINDYVIVKPNFMGDNEIGKINDIVDKFYIIGFELEGYDDTQNYNFTRQDIIHYSENREDLEILMTTDKYNI